MIDQQQQAESDSWRQSPVGSSVVVVVTSFCTVAEGYTGLSLLLLLHPWLPAPASSNSNPYRHGIILHVPCACIMSDSKVVHNFFLLKNGLSWIISFIKLLFLKAISA
jgi:hypothetical protein